MPKDKFNQLFKFNIVKDADDAYTGIAPNREYVRTKFYKNTSRGTHIVEFGNTVNINFDEDFSIYRQFHSLGFSLKAEGGGTFGLGGKGSTSVAVNRIVNVYGTAAGRKQAKIDKDKDEEKIRENLGRSRTCSASTAPRDWRPPGIRPAIASEPSNVDKFESECRCDVFPLLLPKPRSSAASA